MLPVEFLPVVCDHHDAGHNDGFWNLDELVKISCKMADAADYPAFLGYTVTAYPDLLEESPARKRRSFDPTVEALTSEISLTVHAIEAG